MRATVMHSLSVSDAFSRVRLTSRPELNCFARETATVLYLTSKERRKAAADGLILTANCGGIPRRRPWNWCDYGVLPGSRGCRFRFSANVWIRWMPRCNVSDLLAEFAVSGEFAEQFQSKSDRIRRGPGFANWQSFALSGHLHNEKRREIDYKLNLPPDRNVRADVFVFLRRTGFWNCVFCIQIYIVYKFTSSGIFDLMTLSPFLLNFLSITAIRTKRFSKLNHNHKSN